MKKIYLKYLTILSVIIAIILCIVKSDYFHQETSEKIIPVSTISSNEKVVYLTFDDGPSESTKKIINILEKYQIKATFFVVGPEYKLKNDLLEFLIQKNQTIAIHSYSHKYKDIYADVNSYLDDFYKCQNWIMKITNTTPHLYRFPGGSSNTITSKKLIKQIIDVLYKDGYYHVDWNVDSFDSYYNKDSEAIIKNTISQIKTNEKNNIYTHTILMHDNTKKVATINALPTIIEYLLNKGYTFEPLTTNSPLSQHIKRSA